MCGRLCIFFRGSSASKFVGFGVAKDETAHVDDGDDDDDHSMP